jgi:hypothetical protein
MLTFSQLEALYDSYTTLRILFKENEHKDKDAALMAAMSASLLVSQFPDLAELERVIDVTEPN